MNQLFLATKFKRVLQILVALLIGMYFGGSFAFSQITVQSTEASATPPSSLGQYQMYLVPRLLTGTTGKAVTQIPLQNPSKDVMTCAAPLRFLGTRIQGIFPAGIHSDVYQATGTAASVTLTFPPNTHAFSLYLANASNSPAPISISLSANNGAAVLNDVTIATSERSRLFTCLASIGTELSTLTISAADGSGILLSGFAINNEK